jgi:alkanesulfonate monooxygenase SsuD/methylene tetrahydromethanopterin reductase-like flavin-dependent oxidoreductase (luciferase family)
MKVGVMLPIGETDGPDGAPTWADITAVARAAEDGGLDSVWLADHFLYRDADGQEFGLHEAWTELAGVAAVTDRVEVGTLVVCTSFRNPVHLAKMAATLDVVSEGRLILGLGCGWHEPEYQAMGLPFDHLVGRFEEALTIIRGLLAGERVTLEGRYHRADGAILLPPPGRRIPILVAARKERMLALTAKHADAWNTAWYGAPDERLRTRLAGFDAALAAAGRTRDDVVPTVGIDVRDVDQPPVPEPNPHAIAGSVEELAAVLRAYRDLRFGHVMVGLEPISVRSVERLAEAVTLARAS